jgi:hypothetical protein
MDGVAIVYDLLTDNVSVMAAVTRVSAGVLPRGTTLPAISITKVSGMDRNTVRKEATRRVTERIQVTFLAANYPDMKDGLRLVRTALADYIGDVADAEQVTIHTDSAGPDFMDDSASIHMGSQDFMVGFNEPR